MITQYTTIKCEICGKCITEKQLDFSTKFFGEPLCYSCQNLKQYEAKSKYGNKMES